MATTSKESKGDPREELQTWIAEMPCLKSKKNLTREFSDAVLMAEVLKIYYPRYVELHNYTSANSVNTKRENWNLLNRKVLAKIDMKLPKETINQLANSHPGVAEKLLLELKNKVSKVSEGQDSHVNNINKCDNKSTDEEQGQIDFNISDQANSFVPSDNPIVISEPRNYEISKCTSSKKFVKILKWLISWFYIWHIFQMFTRHPFKNFVKTTQNNSANVSGKGTKSETSKEEENIPGHVYVQLKQELREKNDIISTLNHKVTYLESAMKLKDLRISNLTSQLLQNAVENEQIIKLQSGNQLKSTSDRKTLEKLSNI